MTNNAPPPNFSRAANAFGWPAVERRVLVWAAHFHPHVGGVERYTRELWSRVAKRGWGVVVLTTNTEHVAEHEIIDGLLVHRLPVLRLIRGRVPVPIPGRQLREVMAAVAAWSPHVVVTNTRFFPTSVTGVVFGKRQRVPILHIDHGSEHISIGNALIDPLLKAFDHIAGRWVLRNASRCVGVSAAVSNFMARMGRTDCGVLYNGVDTQAFNQAGGNWRERLRLSTSEGLILYVGRLIESKGIFTLLDAFGRLDRPDVHLVIAGDGECMEEVRRRASGRKNIHLLGFVAHDELSSLLASSDIFVHPSDYPEGLPTAVLEAAAAGKAIIATRRGGTSEILPTPKHGLLIAARDPVALRDALEKLLGDAQLREQMGRLARERARQVFDWERIADAAEAELIKLCRSAGLLRA